MEGTENLIQSVMLPISSIETNRGQIPGVPANPRFIRDNKFKKLKKSIEDNPEMLYINEPKVYKYNDKYILIGGNMRVRAMQELGYTSTPAKIIPETATPEQLRAYVIKDNASFGEWELEELLNNWDLQELEDFGLDMPDTGEDIAEEPEAKDDNFTASLPTKAKSKLGDMYILGNHRLVCGDSCEKITMEALMQGTQADAWITDPPYNVDYEGGTGKKIMNDHMDGQVFQDFLAKAFETASDSIKPGGAFYIWYASREHINFETALNRANFSVRQQLIWKKNSLVLGRQDYQWRHEPCLYGWKNGGTHYFTPRRDLTTIIGKEADEPLDFDKMKKEEMKALLEKVFSLPSDIIEEDRPTRSDEHPTMKPIPLIGRLISNSTRKGETIIDTFGGSGSTLIAAEQLGRKCAMVELDPCYVDVIIKRWEDLTGNKAVYFGNFIKGE